jgi:N-acetylmuramoyl-L-alanine amidase
MSMNAGSETPRPKQAILRGIYEQNLRLNGRTHAVSLPADDRSAPRRHRWVRWLLPLPLIAVALGLAAFDAPQTQQRAAAAPPVTQSVAERAPPREVVAHAPASTAALIETVAYGPRVTGAARLAPLAVRSAVRTTATAEPASPPTTSLAEYAAPLLESGHSLKNIFGLGVRTIVIDPGHGGIDPGTSGRLGTLEKEVTLDVARRLKEKLENNLGFRVLLTRDTDSSISLNRRVDFANAAAADLFVSIHVNYLPNTTLNVVETYYFGAHTDAQALQLAERENRGSDYGVSDFESLLRNMRDTMKLQESRRLAQSVQHSLASNIQHTRGKLLDVGTKSAPFVVLLGVKAPAVLAEISCMSSPEAEQRLRTPEHRALIAQHIAAGIVSYLQENTIKGGESHGRERQAKKS